jgi:protein-L-isoaspartate O-methyltransferase
MKLNYRNIIAAAAACVAFQGELMAGKRLLPQFGGAAAVWCGTLLFFQLTLLAAYFGSRWLGRAPAGTRRLVLTALGLSGLLTLLPTLPSAGWLPLELQPLAALLPFGGLALGLFCATPLLHQQQADRHDFSIYAWSNAGALAGLVAYPLVVEPFTGLTVQNRVWAVVGAVICIFGLGGRARGGEREEDGLGLGLRVGSGVGKTRWQWWVLPALSSATLLATTNQLSFEASAGPLTWALPLALFLASYVWAFSGNRQASCGVIVTAGLLALIDTHIMIPPRSASMLGLLLLAGGTAMLACHVWLAATRNENTHGFYTATAAGGVLGSAIMVLVIPRVTSGPVEFPILTLGTLCVAGFKWSGRIMRPILATVGVVAVGSTVIAEAAGRATEVARARTLYGCWRVTKKPGQEFYRLINNSTIHAEEERGNANAGTTYYGAETGFGKLLGEMKQKRAEVDVGVVGLGAGTINRWLRPRDSITYYELDPEAETLARAWFTYLRRDRCRILIGDGRKTLEAQPGPRFDIIVLDAFTGDAIPTHLLTREAGAIYRRHLKPGGVLAVHITNGHVELLPVAEGLARSLGLGCDYVKTGRIEWAILGAEAAPLTGRVIEWTDEQNSILPVLRHAAREAETFPMGW